MQEGTMYITPLRVPTMGLGLDLSSFDQLAIRSACRRASSTIDAVCAVERLEIFATNSQKITIDPSELVINQSGGWIEISSLLLTQYGVFGAGIIPYIGLYNPVIEV